MSGRVMLMSIRPEYADRIFSGEKRYELRRQRPRLEPGDVVLIYTTSPSREVRGAFSVKRVFSMPVAAMWRALAPELGIARAAYDAYFADSASAHAIEVESAKYAS